MENLDHPKYRIYVMMAVMAAAGLMLVGQLIRWQIIEHHHFVALAEAEHQEELVIPPRRGEIRDRQGYLLAADVMQYDISASPKIISNPAQTAQRLAPLIDMSQAELTDALTGKELWVPLVSAVPQAVGQQVLEWGIVGLKVEPRTKRVYPERTFGAHLLGFVNRNGYGFYGVEGFYDSRLRGLPGVQKGERSPFGEIIPLGASHFVPPVSGATLHLTVDRSVQHILSQEIRQAVELYGAQRGSVVVMRPQTGEVLGVANYPSFDPNNYTVTDERLYQNPVVSEQYEPGSVFKIVTMAAGLDAAVVTPETLIYDGGFLEVGGRMIYNWDRQAHQMVDMVDILEKSLNVGIAQVAIELGKGRFYTYLKRFGFGHLTEIDLGNEGPGTLKTPRDANWHESDLGANSYGQGIAVTPMQIATAVSAIANKGILIKPYVVSKIVEAEREINVGPNVVRRAVSEETARTLTNMLVTAMEHAYSQALVPGYQVAGKTGTAEIPIPGGYHPTLTLASFVGFLPADDPQLLILVIIDRPTTSRWGGETAAPTFRQIAEQLVLLFDIPPDEVRLTMHD